MASAKFAKRFSFLASYTFQEAKDDSGNPDTQGKYLPGRPKHQLYAKGVWNEEWLKWFQTALWCDLNYISGNYLDTQNLLSLQNRAMLGSGVTLNFIGHIALSFWAQNILNDRVSDVLGYPMPGRSYWGAIEIKI
jgi:iron complex outermembrane receptor protein